MKVWHAVSTFFVYWYMRLGGYKAWSVLYRDIWEGHRYDDTKIATFASLDLLAAFTKHGALWAKDSWRELFDAVGSPQRAYKIMAGYEPAPMYGLDCDEYAIFVVAAIEKSIAQGVMLDKVSKPRFLTVMWFEGWTSTGHNVCLLELPPAMPTGSPRFCCMDYDAPSAPYNTIEEVVSAVRRKYTKASPLDTFPCCWCAQASDLTPEITQKG